MKNTIALSPIILSSFFFFIFCSLFALFSFQFIKRGEAKQLGQFVFYFPILFLLIFFILIILVLNKINNNNCDLITEKMANGKHSSQATNNGLHSIGWMG